jgi:hypothetical protein
MMTMSTTEKSECLRDHWRAEFEGHALAALVDQAMGDYPDSQEIGTPGYNLRLVLEAPFRRVPLETLSVWAHRIDRDVLDFESYTERETGE